MFKIEVLKKLCQSTLCCSRSCLHKGMCSSPPYYATVPLAHKYLHCYQLVYISLLNMFIFFTRVRTPEAEMPSVLHRLLEASGTRKGGFFNSKYTLTRNSPHQLLPSAYLNPHRQGRIKPFYFFSFLLFKKNQQIHTSYEPPVKIKQNTFWVVIDPLKCSTCRTKTNTAYVLSSFGLT